MKLTARLVTHTHLSIYLHIYIYGEYIFTANDTGLYNDIFIQIYNVP